MLLIKSVCVLWCLLTGVLCVLWCVVDCGSVHSLCVLLTDAQCVLWCVTEDIRVSAASHHWHQCAGCHCLGPRRCTAVS